MAVALRIARLNAQLRLPADSSTEGVDQSWLRELSQRQLPAALAGMAERALARAGLPQEAVVAVRQLRLRLELEDGASDRALLKAWSQAMEQALVLALTRARLSSGLANRGLDPLAASHGSTDNGAAAPAVVFADTWAAEMAHLAGLLRSGRPAWWADRLLDGRGEPLDLTPAAILRRWLDRHPARAVALMAQLADLPSPPQGLATLVPEAEAQWLAGAMAGLLSQRPAAAQTLPEAGSSLRALLETALAGLRRHPRLGAAAGLSAASACLWRLALLLRAQPALALLSPAALLAVAAAAPDSGQPAQPDPPATGPAQSLADGIAPDGAQGALPSPEPATEPSQGPALQSAWIFAGGLLLLLNRPELFAPPPDGSAPEPAPPGDLALLVLQRLLAPLGPGERAAALQRERPLLALGAPDRVWPERIEQAQLQDPAAAERQLALLIGTIPEAIGFAPAALRQVYGLRHGATPPLPDREGHRLAALVWRPGLLAWDGWEISLSWPLASVDGALRRGGWDLDPGWQPALRRVVRFHYRAELSPAPGEEP